MAGEFVPYTGAVVTRAEARSAGLTRYFTGKACCAGHVSERLVSKADCIQCKAATKAANRGKANALEKRWRENNPDAYKARIARYLGTDKAKVKRAAYYQENACAIKQRTREWVEQNPDQARANREAWYLANVDAVKQRVKEWSEANPEACRSASRNYRARARQAEGHHIAADIQRIGDAQKWKCHWCSRPTRKGYHVDHVQPLSKGGSNWPTNLVISCGPCNVSKRASDPIAFAQRLGLLL